MIGGMFTDTSIKKLPPKSAAYREFDSCGILGFGVKIYPTGTKVFELRVYRGGKSKYYRLGEFGKTPLAATRDKARLILSRLDQGLPALDDNPARPSRQLRHPVARLDGSSARAGPPASG